MPRGPKDEKQSADAIDNAIISTATLNSTTGDLAALPFGGMVLSNFRLT